MFIKTHTKAEGIFNDLKTQQIARPYEEKTR